MSWWGLHSVFEQNRQEFEAFISAPIPACPHDGEPLVLAPTTAAGASIERFCRFDGFAWPRDYVTPRRLA
jgi:hypothetical protein